MQNFDLDRLDSGQTIVMDSSLAFSGIVPWTRAVSLVVTDEAAILIPRSRGEVIRSKSLTLAKPLVVSLHKYVGRQARSMSPSDHATRTMILARDNWTCAYCHGYGDTIDHITPKSRGGNNTWGNLCVACQPCNNRKGDMTPDEMGWKYPVIPKTVTSRRRELIQDAVYTRLGAM